MGHQNGRTISNRQDRKKPKKMDMTGKVEESKRPRNKEEKYQVGIVCQLI